MYILVKSRQGKLILQNNPDRKQKSNNVFEISKQKTILECIYKRKMYWHDTEKKAE